MPLRLPSGSYLHLPRCLRNLPLPRLRRVPRSTQCIELVDLDLDDAAFRYQHEHHAWEQSPPAPPNSPAAPRPPVEGDGLRLLSVEGLEDLVDFDVGFDLGLDRLELGLMGVGFDGSASGSAAAKAPSDGFSFAKVARTARGRLGRGVDAVRNRNLEHVTRAETHRLLHHTPAAPSLALEPPPMNSPAHPPRWRCCRCNHVNIPTSTSTIDNVNCTTTPTFHPPKAQTNDLDTGIDTREEDAARTPTCPCGHSLEPCLLKARLHKLSKVQRRGGDLGVAFVRA